MLDYLNDFLLMAFKFMAAGGGLALLVFAVGTAADIVKNVVFGGFHREE